MCSRWRRIAWLMVVFVLRPEGSLRAEDVPIRASDQRTRLAVPAGLPRYEIDARLDLDRRLVTARERVRFTNRAGVATRELVLHVYPRYQVQDQDRAILSKTLEVLRLSPEEAMDTEGRRMDVAGVRVDG